jgi:hypothetical protein
VAAGHRDAAGKTGNAAAAFFIGLITRPEGKGEVKSRRVSSRARPGWVFRVLLDSLIVPLTSEQKQ